MMAWKAGEEEHLLHFLDPWRVSSLIRAFFELLLALFIFLGAIISFTTTRLIKSSGLITQNCASCAVREQHRQSLQGSELKAYEELADSCDVTKDGGSCGGRCRLYPPISIKICENCTHFLSNCGCAWKHGFPVVDDNNCPVNLRCPRVTGPKNIIKYDLVDCASYHTVVGAPDDDTDSSGRKERPLGSCSWSAENIEYMCDDGSTERVVADRTSKCCQYGCERQSHLGIPVGRGRSWSSENNPIGSLKRKFAKVSPNNDDSMARWTSSCSCGSLSANVCAERKYFVISGGRPAEIRESGGDSNDDYLQPVYNPVLYGDSLLDGRAGQNPTSICPEASAKDSSRESISNTATNRSRSLPGGAYQRANLSRNTLELLVDTNFLAAESRRLEWCGSLSSRLPHSASGNEGEMDMEEDATEAGSTTHHEQDLKIGAMDIREAFHDEQDALVALYQELEEERNAASSAAQEAMAMITRLQEEKAAIQMEALQYQRIAEEKYKYDQEAMALLQEILAKREEDVNALEEEVNTYRNNFDSLGMEGPNNRSSGGRDMDWTPMGNGVLLIEQDKWSVEGNEDWKNRMDSKPVVEFKDWLHEASSEEVVAPPIFEEVDVFRSDFPNGTMDLPLPGNVKKSVFESFSSFSVPRKDGIVAMGEIRRNGIVSEESEIHTDRAVDRDYETHGQERANEEAGSDNTVCAEGYESVQGMVESWSQKPSLKDDEFLETSKTMEDKFRRQSSEEVRRNGDELRQIWKSILKSFESEERGEESGEREGGDTDLMQSSNHADTIDTDADRSVGEKRMSVLECVWRFEEIRNRKSHLQPTKAALSTHVESGVETSLELSRASSELMDSDKSKNSTLGRDRPVAPIKSRLFKHRASDTRNASADAERDSFLVRGEGLPSSERATRSPDAISYRNPDFVENNKDGSSIVHDVNEIQGDLRETISDVSSYFSEGKGFVQNCKKYVLTPNELVPGQFIESHEISRWLERYPVDNGTPDFIGDHTLEEHEANGKGRPDWGYSTARVIQSIKESGRCMQAARTLPGEYMDTSGELDGYSIQWQSSEVTDSPRMQTQDVLQQLTNRLKALETDRQILQAIVASLERENADMKIFQGNAQQLRALRGIDQTPVAKKNMRSADDAGIVSSIKGMLSWDKLRPSVQSLLSKLVQLFPAKDDPGSSQGEQRVSLFRLLHKSPVSKHQTPIETAKSLRVVYAANSSYSSDQVHPFMATLNPLECQYTWPMSIKERSETALSGWDY